jgi:two-component system response regulator RstA
MMTIKPSVLLVDDDIELCQLITSYLQHNGYDVSVLHDGHGASAFILEQDPDLVILDLMLPHVDGLTICKEVRHDYHGSIIMLTALDDDIDEVTGLEVGADDYLAKPVKPRVLLAHIRAQLRHLEKRKRQFQPIKFGDQYYTLLTESRTLMYENIECELTSAEYEVLFILAQHSGEIVSRYELHQLIFNFEFDGIDRSIDLRISRLRNKLALYTGKKNIIQTVRNKGYLLMR